MPSLEAIWRLKSRHDLQKTKEGKSSMDFRVKNTVIKNLLSEDRVYNIPRFQRDYSWEEEQCETFLKDLIKQISFSGEEMRASDYFLGTMIFSGAEDSPAVDVVDGQQRLTTVTILLAVLRDAFRTFGKEESDKTAIEKGDRLQTRYIMREDDDGRCYEVIKTNTSYPFFSRMIQDKENCTITPDAASLEEEHVKDMYNWFESQLRKETLYALFEDTLEVSLANFSYLDALSALRDQLLRSTVIAIFALDSTQAYSMFENINSKGLSLSSIDLIKNAILSVLETRGIDDEPAELWAQYKQCINKAGESFDVFFVDYWKATFPADKANVKSLYQKYQKRYHDADRRQLEELLVDLRDAVNVYSELINPDENKYKKQQTKYELECLKALNSFGAKQVLPTMLALYLSEVKAAAKEKKKFLYLITDVHFAAFGLNSGLRSNKFTGPFRRFTIALEKASNRGDLHKAMHDLEQELVGYLDRQLFIENFMQLRFSKKNKAQGKEKRAASYALRRVANKMASRDYSDNDTSIEHIIDESTDFEGSLLMGNLTILETKFNNDLSSISTEIDPMEQLQAKSGVYEQSKVPMTLNLLEEYGSQGRYGTEEIYMRTLWMAEYFWDTFIQPYNMGNNPD